MSSDPLPLPEIWSDLPKGDAYESTRTALVANGRSGLVLIEYASGFAQSDPQPVVRPREPAEQAAANERGPSERVPGERVASLAPAALAKGLADLAAIVTQAEALLRAQGVLKGDVHFAVERIHDVAMALRMRDVDSALCDALDASVREVGDAVVRHEAAATGALSAAAWLRDIMRRIEDLVVVASRMIASDADPLDRPSGRQGEAAIEPVAIVAKTEAIIEGLAPVASEAEATIETPAPVVTERQAATDSLAIVPVEAGGTNPTVAPVASEAEPAIEPLAPPVTEAEAAIDTPAPVAPEAQAAVGTSALVASEAESANEAAAPDMTEGPAAIETSAPVVSEAEAMIEAQADAFSTGPEAETGHRAEAEAIYSPLTPAADILISDEDHARSLLDAACENVTIGDDALPETQASAEPADDAAVLAESLAAVDSHQQDDINAAPEAPEHQDEAASAAVGGEAASAGPVIETASVSPAAAADTSAVPATRSEQEPPHVASSPSVDESGSVAAKKLLRPANDPFAALHGLSEEELIALFS
jgi:hypothetical protein